MKLIQSIAFPLTALAVLCALPGCVDDASDTSIEADRVVQLQQGGEKLASVNLDQEADLVFARLDNGRIVVAGLISKTASEETNAKLDSIDLNDVAGSYARLAREPDVFAVERLEKSQSEARTKEAPLASFTDTSYSPRLSRTDFNSTFCGAPPAGWDIKCTERTSPGTFASVNSGGKQIYLSMAERGDGTGGFTHTLETRWCSARVFGLCVGIILTIVQVEQYVPGSAYSMLLESPPEDDSIRTKVSSDNDELSYLIAAHILAD